MFSWLGAFVYEIPFCVPLGWLYVNWQGIYEFHCAFLPSTPSVVHFRSADPSSCSHSRVSSATPPKYTKHQLHRLQRHFMFVSVARKRLHFNIVSSPWLWIVSRAI